MDDEKSNLEVFNIVQDLTDKLTIKRILTILLAGILITLCTIFYENRAMIFESTYHAVTGADVDTKNWKISSATQEELTVLVNTVPAIKMAMISEVDLQKNRRHPSWWVLTDPKEPEIRRALETTLPRPVFDYDPKNTQQMVQVLNNEFVCSNTVDTTWRHNFGDLAKRMPVVCRIAIPPFYGKLVGMLTIGLNVQPSKAQLDAIRIEAARLAVDIYLRDVVKKPLPGSSSGS